MRITGLASGLDTETMINDMMKAHRMPLDKIFQRKQYMEWQRDDYRTINRQLNDMSNKTFDTIMKQSTFLAKTVSVSSPDAVSLKSVNATSEFSGTISVTRLASQATMQSNDRMDTAIGFDTKKTMNELGFTGTGSITINSIGADGNMPAEAKTITFDPAVDSLETVLKKINSESGVSAFYDSFTGKIAVTAKNSGDAKDSSEIIVNGDLATFFKLDADNISAGVNGKAGVNAEFTFNGLTTERSSNNFLINGFEITLKQVTASPVTFSSSPDTDKVVSSVVNFINDYNKMIEELNTKIREPIYRDFKPLSTEQKEDMKEKEIELWEEKAKSGTLKNEPILTSMLEKMRKAFNGSVEGTSGSIRLSEIGISPSKNYLDNGKLIIDETKLREAINTDPNKVYEVFAKPGTTEADKGLAVRFRSAIAESRNKITEKAGAVGSVNNNFALGRILKSFDSQINRFEDRLKMVENRYYRQFGAMESAIQKANQQSAYLMNSFG
ncbi:MAG: flagellar hook-associated protein 2 [Firmicutes bacterium]|nr:flagellar hook-associated protein 2 [Bacillota bacterium]